MSVAKVLFARYYSNLKSMITVYENLPDAIWANNNIGLQRLEATFKR